MPFCLAKYTQISNLLPFSWINSHVYVCKYMQIYVLYTCVCIDVCVYRCYFFASSESTTYRPKDDDEGDCRAGTHCNMLQHAATCCNTLQHTTTHCNTLPHTATHSHTHSNTLQHTAQHCNTLQHTATHCNTLQRNATHCNALQHTAMHMQDCLLRQCSLTTTHCNTPQHTSTHHNAHAGLFTAAEFTHAQGQPISLRHVCGDKG